MLKEDRDTKTFILTFHFCKILLSPVPDVTFPDTSNLIFALKSFLEVESNRAKSLGSSSVKVHGRECINFALPNIFNRICPDDPELYSTDVF